MLLLLACFQKDVPGIDTSTQDADGDGVEWIDDCDDDDSSVGAAPTWYADSDGDGDGDPDRSTESCEQPNGFVESSGDCDDT